MAIQARTAPTFQAVTLTESLMGFGKVPSFTLRQRVGALKGKGAGVLGRLGLWTSWDSRMNALSGKTSNTEGLRDIFSGKRLDALAGLDAMGLGDIAYRPMKLTDAICRFYL